MIAGGVACERWALKFPSEKYVCGLPEKVRTALPKFRPLIKIEQRR
jgi:hypothetical protein